MKPKNEVAVLQPVYVLGSYYPVKIIATVYKKEGDGGFNSIQEQKIFNLVEDK